MLKLSASKDGFVMSDTSCVMRLEETVALIVTLSLHGSRFTLHVRNAPRWWSARTSY